MCVIMPSSRFLHLEKCGGTWVGQVIEALGIPNQRTADIHAPAADLPGEELLSWGLIRHPWSWYASLWAQWWFKNQYLPDRDIHPSVQHQRAFVRPRVDEWVESLNAAFRGYLSHRVTDVLAGAMVYRWEDCPDVLVAPLRREINFDVALLRQLAHMRSNQMSQSAREASLATFTDAALDRVVACDREVFERFGYAQNKCDWREAWLIESRDAETMSALRRLVVNPTASQENDL